MLFKNVTSPFLFLCCLFFGMALPSSVLAQNDVPGLEITLMLGTHWKYSHTVHVASQTVVHKAENDDYQFWLQFSPDNSYQQYLNGKLTHQQWHTLGYQLYMPFKGVDKFSIAHVDGEMLLLEFAKQPTSSRHQYVFKAQNPNTSKLPRIPNEIPLVEVKRKRKGAKEDGARSWWASRKETPVGPKLAPVFIQVELINGGFYGGIDPVLKDYISIKNDGRLIMEHESLYSGLTKHKKNITRQELEQFVEWVGKQGFFDMKTTYACLNSACYTRQTRKPKPIPMRLAITYGKRRKVVAVDIWQPTSHDLRFVDYPSQLDNIVDAIVRMANRPVSSS